MAILKKSLISTFVAIHVIMMVTAALPDRSAVGLSASFTTGAHGAFYGRGAVSQVPAGKSFANGKRRALV